MKIKPVERPDEALVARFENIPTSTFSDILDEMGLECLVSGIRAVKQGFKPVGPILTIKEISGPLGTYRTEDFQMGKVIDTAQPGDVLVFDNSGKEISTWGGGWPRRQPN
jgi:regulator of RNase E activity RraA